MQYRLLTLFLFVFFTNKVDSKQLLRSKNSIEIQTQNATEDGNGSIHIHVNVPTVNDVGCDHSTHNLGICRGAKICCTKQDIWCCGSNQVCGKDFGTCEQTKVNTTQTQTLTNTTNTKGNVTVPSNVTTNNSPHKHRRRKHRRRKHRRRKRRRKHDNKFSSRNQ